MPSQIALIATFSLIIWLLYEDAHYNKSVSKALWIPTIFFAIISSRNVGAWFTGNTTSIAAGSVYDRIVLNSLFILTIIVLLKRGVPWLLFFRQNIFLFILLAYMGISVLWSEFPYNSFKRWMKIVIFPFIAFLIYSEQKPLDALQTVFRRCAFINIPLSLCLIKWFPAYGVMHSYSGVRMATGVTRHKNSLGLICMLFAFILIWGILKRIRTKEIVEKKSFLIAELITICMALFMLFGGASRSYSATSITLFIISIALLLILYTMKNFAQTMAKHLKKAVIILAILFIYGNTTLLPMVSSLLGRAPNLTGRDKIWSSVLEVANRHPWIGTGYGGYWGLVEWEFSFNYKVDQAHNGYLNVLMELGRIGMCLLLVYVLSFIIKIQKFYFLDTNWGSLGICFVTGMLLYNYSEAAFIRENIQWGAAVFLSVVFNESSIESEENNWYG